MLSLALLDKVLSINVKKAQITVQAGARVQEVCPLAFAFCPALCCCLTYDLLMVLNHPS